MEPNNYSEDSFDQSAEYSPKSEFSKPLVVMETVKKCIDARAKEMTKGYYNTTITKDGLPIKMWIEDSRKVYVSCVTALRKLLIPEILEDEKYKSTKEGETKPLEKIDKKMKEKKKAHSYTFLEVDSSVKHKRIFKKTDKKFMPEIDAVVEVRRIFPDGNESLDSVPGYWDPHVNAYWDNMVELNDDLFEQLMRVIHRKNYFKQQIRVG